LKKRHNETAKIYIWEIPPNKQLILKIKKKGKKAKADKTLKNGNVLAPKKKFDCFPWISGV